MGGQTALQLASVATSPASAYISPMGGLHTGALPTPTPAINGLTSAIVTPTTGNTPPPTLLNSTARVSFVFYQQLR